MKDIVHYKQHGDTCVICCVLMILEAFGFISKVRKYDEKNLFNKLKSQFIGGTPFSAAAWYLSKRGLSCELIHLEENFFKNDNYIDEDTFEILLNEYKRWCSYCEKKNVKITNGMDITKDFLVKRIICGDKIILAGMVDNTLHAIVVEKFVDDKFVICDPLKKDKEIVSFKYIDQYKKTPLGEWCICVKK